MSNVIGIDLGGTNIAAGRVDEAGRVLARQVRPTPVKEGAGAVAAAMVEVAKSLRDGETLAVGAVSPGLIDGDRGVCVGGACNIPGWEGTPLAERMGGPLGLPGFAENDANAAALAENWIGAGRGARVCLMLTLGTGVGGGAVLGGQVFRGANGFAAEFGHFSINYKGEKCACGGVGCAEMYASATALARLGARNAVGAGAKKLLELAGGRAANVTAKMVCDAARAGDKLAGRVLDEYSAALAATIASLINAWNPDCLVVGGGLGLSWDLLEPRVRKELAAGRALPKSLAACKVVAAALRDESGIVGAAKVAWNGLKSRG